MAEIKNSESDMSTQQKAELDKEKRKEEKKEAKRAKRQHYRELNEPPKLTVLEEVGNAVTHGIGAGLIQHCCCELRFQSVLKDIHLTNYRFTISYDGTRYHGWESQ